MAHSSSFKGWRPSCAWSVFPRSRECLQVAHVIQRLAQCVQLGRCLSVGLTEGLCCSPTTCPLVWSQLAEEMAKGTCLSLLHGASWLATE